jgi:hypothetical protein
MRWLSSRVVAVIFFTAVYPTFETVEKEVWIWISYRFWVALLQVLMVFSHGTQEVSIKTELLWAVPLGQQNFEPFDPFSWQTVRAC